MVAWGEDRNTAIANLTQAIKDFRINGIETTLPFGIWAINHEAFVAGKFDTHFIANYFKPELLLNFSEDEKQMAAMMATSIFVNEQKIAEPLKPLASSWKMRKNLR